MNCKDVTERLLFYLDNELDAKAREALEIHVAECPACQKELQALSTTRDLLVRGFQTALPKAAPVWAWIELEQRLAGASRDKVSRAKSLTTKAKSLVSWPPRWKPILSGVLVLVLVISSAVFIPRNEFSSLEAEASEIAGDTPEVMALAGGEPSARETKVSGAMGYVLSVSASGDSNLAYVDLREDTVVRLFRIPVLPLTEEDRRQAISIAWADRNAKRILENGGAISDMFPLPSRLRLDIVDDQPVVWAEGILVGEVLKLNNLMWLARIDLTEMKVVDVSMVTPSTIPSRFERPPALHSKEELLEMAKSDTRVSALLAEGAEVAHVALGRGKMAMSGAIILKHNDEFWSVRVDLKTHAVTRVELIPEARHGKSNIFNPV